MPGSGYYQLLGREKRLQKCDHLLLPLRVKVSRQDDGGCLICQDSHELFRLGQAFLERLEQVNAYTQDLSALDLNAGSQRRARLAEFVAQLLIKLV